MKSRKPILLLDTSTNMSCLTIFSSSGEQFEAEWESGRDLARGLLAWLKQSLLEHDLIIENIGAIGVFKGPGSFTGLRIGLTVMNTFSSELDIPIVGETGDNWRNNAIRRLDDGDNDKLVMPDYGRPARITSPRK